MSKYQYITSFDKAIEAGVSKEQYSRESSKNVILSWIANELAETNRLKRLELEDKIKTENEEVDWDLSDNA